MSKSGKPRALTSIQEAEILVLVRLRRTLTNPALAKKFGVSKSTIDTIANERRQAIKVKACLRIQGAGRSSRPTSSADKP